MILLFSFMFLPAPIQKIFLSEENMEDAIFRTLQLFKETQNWQRTCIFYVCICTVQKMNCCICCKLQINRKRMLGPHSSMAIVFSYRYCCSNGTLRSFVLRKLQASHTTLVQNTVEDVLKTCWDNFINCVFWEIT